VQRDLLRYSLLHSVSILLAYLTLLELPPYVCCAPRKLGLSLSLSLFLSPSPPLVLSLFLSFSPFYFSSLLPLLTALGPTRSRTLVCSLRSLFGTRRLPLDPMVDHATPTKAKRDANTGPTNAELFLSWRPLVSDLASAAWRVSPWTNERFERVFICAECARARARTRDFCGKIGRSFLTTPARLINVRYLHAA